MTLKWRSACLWVIPAVVLASQSPPVSAARSRDHQDQQPTFRLGTDLVRVDASVRRQGRPFAGLRAADFEILDNGVAQNVVNVSYEKLPIDVTVALDISQSVTGEVLDQLRRTVQQLKTDLAPSDRLKLMTFNMQIRRIVDFSTPASLPSPPFGSMSGLGSTAILDTISVALATPVLEDRRQLIVVFSDGQDSSSISDPTIVLDVARRTTPTVDVVLPSALPASTTVFQMTTVVNATATLRLVYTQIANETGGIVVNLFAGENLTSAFRRAVEEFRSSYVLYYTPTGVDRRGSHTLAVRITRPGQFDVRSRNSYSWR